MLPGKETVQIDSPAKQQLLSKDSENYMLGKLTSLVNQKPSSESLNQSPSTLPDYSAVKEQEVQRQSIPVNVFASTPQT